MFGISHSNDVHKKWTRQISSEIYERDVVVVVIWQTFELKCWAAVNPTRKRKYLQKKALTDFKGGKKVVAHLLSHQIPLHRCTFSVLW